MIDAVDALDAFEAKRKRAAKPLFEVERWAFGGGCYVRATLTDGTVDRIDGFATEGEARRWIKMNLSSGYGARGKCGRRAWSKSCQAGRAILSQKNPTAATITPPQNITIRSNYPFSLSS
jgi:hypothetical protein